MALYDSEPLEARLGDEAAGEPLGPLSLGGRRVPVEVYKLA